MTQISLTPSLNRHPSEKLTMTTITDILLLLLLLLLIIPPSPSHSLQLAEGGGQVLSQGASPPLNLLQLALQHLIPCLQALVHGVEIPDEYALLQFRGHDQEPLGVLHNVGRVEFCLESLLLNLDMILGPKLSNS